MRRGRAREKRTGEKKESGRVEREERTEKQEEWRFAEEENRRGRGVMRGKRREETMTRR